MRFLVPKAGALTKLRLAHDERQVAWRRRQALAIPRRHGL
jgi:hypothetical protein